MIDFDYRNYVITMARARYIKTGVTLNITDALRLYLANDAGEDEQIPLFITSPEIHRIAATLAQIRPTCDECGSGLFLQVHARDPKGEMHATAWACKVCGLVEYSDRTPAEWLEELNNETREQNLQKPDEPDPGDVPIRRETSQI